MFDTQIHPKLAEVVGGPALDEVREVVLAIERERNSHGEDALLVGSALTPASCVVVSQPNFEKSKVIM